MRRIAYFSAAAVLLSATIAFAQSKSMTVGSGQIKMVGHHYRVDRSDVEHPVSVNVTVPPRNGSVTTKRAPATRTVRGQQRRVTETQVFYRSKTGFVGQDSFTYQRTSADPSDFMNQTITVSVTVR